MVVLKLIYDEALSLNVLILYIITKKLKYNFIIFYIIYNINII